LGSVICDRAIGLFLQVAANILDHFTGISSVLHDLWRRMCEPYEQTPDLSGPTMEECVNETGIKDSPGAADRDFRRGAA